MKLVRVKKRLLRLIFAEKGFLKVLKTVFEKYDSNFILMILPKMVLITVHLVTIF